MAELVARLEGIPLALELAAARVRSLTVADINVRLKDRYKLLTGGGRVLLERQQTLRALVDWSYDLLQATRAGAARETGGVRERVRARIGRGGLRRRASGAGGRARLAHLPGRQVVGPDGGAQGRDALQDARDDPGLRRREADSAQRVRGDRRAALQPLFRDGEGREQGPEGPEHAEWIRRFESELDNLRAAITLALQRRCRSLSLRSSSRSRCRDSGRSEATRPRVVSMCARHSRSRRSRRQTWRRGTHYTWALRSPRAKATTRKRDGCWRRVLRCDED